MALQMSPQRRVAWSRRQGPAEARAPRSGWLPNLRREAFDGPPCLEVDCGGVSLSKTLCLFPEPNGISGIRAKSIHRWTQRAGLQGTQSQVVPGAPGCGRFSIRGCPTSPNMRGVSIPWTLCRATCWRSWLASESRD